MMIVYEQIRGSWFYFSVADNDWSRIAFPRARCIWHVPGTEDW